MKTLTEELLKDILSDYALSNEEMIYVRGGEGDPVTLPSNPPIKI
jgi:hypothetical protein